MYITPEQIKAQAQRWYYAFLRHALTGEVFFPKPVRFRKPKPSEVAGDFQQAHQTLLALRKHSKAPGKPGYTVNWETTNNRNIGRNEFPSSIVIDGKEDFLALLSDAQRAEFAQFEKSTALAKARIPALADWMAANVRKVVEHGTAWPSLLAVCDYFMQRHTPWVYYIRELPVNVHTKFIENHKAVLNELLSFLLPPDRLYADKKGVKGHNFEKRYGLKHDQPMVDIRFLDQPQFGVLDRLALPLDAFAQTPLASGKIVITENKNTFLALPKIPDAIGIFGGGFQAIELGRVAWLREREIYYWGDLDAYGFYILSQLRKAIDYAMGISEASVIDWKVKSMMMDQATFDRFNTHGEGKPVSEAVDLSHLTAIERQLFADIQAANARLEQEHIPHAYVLAQFARLA